MAGNGSHGLMNLSYNCCGTGIPIRPASDSCRCASHGEHFARRCAILPLRVRRFGNSVEAGLEVGLQKISGQPHDQRWRGPARELCGREDSPLRTEFCCHPPSSRFWRKARRRRSSPVRRCRSGLSRNWTLPPGTQQDLGRERALAVLDRPLRHLRRLCSLPET